MPESIHPLDYYARHSRITDPREHINLFVGLPTDIPSLCKVVQGLLIHIFWAERYGLQLPDVRKQEVQLRHVTRTLARIRELDDQPLSASKHILITALAQDKQTNTQYNADGSQILALGGPPLLLQPVQATIALKGGAPKEVNVVDIYGVPAEKKVKLDGAAFTIDGTYKTYYYEVKR